MPPNVLVVLLDATRRDALEPYGAPEGSSSALAQVASRGTAMPDVHATGCWTVPSHSSIFTGLMPRAAGLSRVGSPSAAKPVLESHLARLLPEVMRRAGYRTSAVSANLWLSEESGFGLGFDDFVQVDSDRHGQLQGEKAVEKLRWFTEAGLARVDDGARAAEAVLEGWIDRAAEQERPFFWFVNLMEAHSPYLPPRPFGGVSLLDRLRAAEDARRYYTLVGIWQACSGVTRVPESTLERMRALYAASVRYMDDWVGRILERLDAKRILDDTLVVAVADHGENLGENGLIAHSLSLDERLIHVPLIAAGPGAEGPAITSLAAFPRWLAEAAGVEGHPYVDGPPSELGVAQMDSPLDADDPDLQDKLARAGLAEATETFTTDLSCAVSGNLKLVRRGGEEQAYDMLTDPLESRPVRPEQLPDHGDGIAALRSALDHPSMARGTRASQPATPEELSDLEARMRLLGYM